MATAADKSGDRDCELCYLKAALMGSPKDPACNRLYAIALTDRGLIDQAITFWHRVEEALPNDDEAKRSIASLTVQKARSSGKFDEETTKSRTAEAEDPAAGGIDPRTAASAEDPERAGEHRPLAGTRPVLHQRGPLSRRPRGCWPRPTNSSDGDVDIREKWEDCQLRHMRQKIAQTRDPEAKKKLEHEYFEKERGVLPEPGRALSEQPHLQVRTRLPLHEDQAVRRGDPGVAGRQERPPPKGACMLVLGECFQQIKQYRLAKTHYESAIQEIPDREADNKKTGVLPGGPAGLVPAGLRCRRKTPHHPGRPGFHLQGRLASYWTRSPDYARIHRSQASRRSRRKTQPRTTTAGTRRTARRCAVATGCNEP